MALLLLQDCLIDLSAPIGKNASISLDGGLVNKMVENGCFNEDDSDKLLEEIKKFIKEDYRNGVIYLSSVFYNIPFFEERLIEETRLKVKSIFHYVRNEDDNTTEIKLLEIGKYFRCETTFDYQQSKRISFKIESFNLNQKLSEIFEPDACYPLADIETIVKLNSYAEENCVENSELRYLTLQCFIEQSVDIDLDKYYKALKDHLEKITDNQKIVSLLSLMPLFEVDDMVKLQDKQDEQDRDVLERSNYSVGLFPTKLSFDDEIVFNFWTDNNQTDINVSNGNSTKQFRIKTEKESSGTLSLSKLNLNKAVFKVDGLNNLSYKIIDFKNNSTIVVAKINFS